MTIEEYLSEDEPIITQVSTTKFSDTADKYQFGKEWTVAATDRRIMLMSNKGDFKDINYNHIKTVESKDKHTPARNGKEDAEKLAVIGVIVSPITFFIVEPILGVLLLIMSIMIGVFAKYYPDTEEKSSTAIKVKYGDTKKGEILELTTDNQTDARAFTAAIRS